jgi:hypothetical protein
MQKLHTSRFWPEVFLLRVPVPPRSDGLVGGHRIVLLLVERRLNLTHQGHDRRRRAAQAG